MHKYREGKMQRTLKRELKVPEIVKRKAIVASVLPSSDSAVDSRPLLVWDFIALLALREVSSVHFRCW